MRAACPAAENSSTGSLWLNAHRITGHRNTDSPRFLMGRRLPTLSVPASQAQTVLGGGVSPRGTQRAHVSPWKSLPSGLRPGWPLPCVCGRRPLQGVHWKDTGSHSSFPPGLGAVRTRGSLKTRSPPTGTELLKARPLEPGPCAWRANACGRRSCHVPAPRHDSQRPGARPRVTVSCFHKTAPARGCQHKTFISCRVAGWRSKLGVWAGLGPFSSQKPSLQHFGNTRVTVTQGHEQAA